MLRGGGSGGGAGAGGDDGFGEVDGAGAAFGPVVTDDGGVCTCCEGFLADQLEFSGCIRAINYNEVKVSSVKSITT